ncbi:hypothetical protein FRC00_008540, partial [Tulasnella sp. 408]
PDGTGAEEAVEVDVAEDDEDEDAPFLLNKVNRQLPPQICAGFPTQLDTQSVAATLVLTLNVFPQKHCVLLSNPT